MNFTMLDSFWRLLGAVLTVAGDWSLAALDAAINRVRRLFAVTSVMLLVTIFGTAAVAKLFDDVNMGRSFALGCGYLFLILITWSAANIRTLHAIGLVAAADVTASVVEFWTTGKVTIHKVNRMGQDKDQWNLQLIDQTRLKFATLQFLMHWFWILVNCGFLTAMFCFLIPYPGYALLTAFAFFSGLNWLWSHKEFDFAFFEWWGTFIGITGFMGGVLYMLLDYHELVYMPELGYLVAGAVGFTWPTEHIKKHTLKVALAGAFVLKAAWAWKYTTMSLSAPALNLTSNQLAIIGLLIVAVLLAAVYIFGDVKLEKAESGHGGH